MAGLVPAIHAYARLKTWMPGTRPGMTRRATMQNLKIDGERLWDDLMETARIGATPKGGICRLTLTDLDRQARDWFKSRAEALGCVVTIDDMGNMFARRAGQRADVPPIAFGSHLDTQPTGGKFDGALGVLAALEALRSLHAATRPSLRSKSSIGQTRRGPASSRR
jgi:hypothetical protein